MAYFSQDQLEAIAAALGDTDRGLTGPEIKHLFSSSRMTTCSAVLKGIYG
jgi:hypothetical protein